MIVSWVLLSTGWYHILGTGYCLPMITGYYVLSTGWYHILGIRYWVLFADDNRVLKVAPMKPLNPQILVERHQAMENLEL